MTLTVAGLLDDYRVGRRRPTNVVRDVIDSIEGEREPIWISRVEADTLMAAARALEHDGGLEMPLYGVPFAVKDNLDVSGMPTTAGCPQLTDLASETAVAVERLIAAGALLVGKVNMDQFATGLVGTRSPYGALSCVYDRGRVSGGSSSGSAVAVASGQVAFALGTDTAGSGRVPAAFNGLVGCKPTLGLISTRGVLPACASLDCVSIFSHTVADAAVVLDVLSAYEDHDPWSRPRRPTRRARRGLMGVPLPAQAELDEPESEVAWEAAVERAAEHWEIFEVDIAPMLDAGPLLYDIWVAERTAVLGPLIERSDAGLDPTVAAIVASGAQRTAAEVFRALHRLAQLKRQAETIWDQVDALMLPTAPGHPTHAQVAAAPLDVNTRLGRYTNFVNLLDLAAVALPAGLRGDGLPFGISLLAPAWSDQRLLELGAEWMGEPTPDLLGGDGAVLAVAGAHMSGQPLSSQLSGRGARSLGTTVTSACYRFYELPGGGLPRPGLVRVHDGGAAIEVELWQIAPEALGELMLTVPPPLAIGTVELADGTQVAGFVCEGYAARDAVDITRYGGWRGYLHALNTS